MFRAREELAKRDEKTMGVVTVIESDINTWSGELTFSRDVIVEVIEVDDEDSAWLGDFTFSRDVIVDVVEVDEQDDWDKVTSGVIIIEANGEESD